MVGPPPQLILNQKNRVIGAVDRPESFEARIWLAQNQDGLYIAADVKDDKVLLPKAESPLINSDHLELWLSSPVAEMPPLGFANQFDSVSVPNQAACKQENVSDEATCLEWYKKQGPYRQLLSKLFTHQYLFDREGLYETWYREAWNKQQPKDLPDDLYPVLGGRFSKYIQNKTGYSFEAMIPTSSLPFVADPELKQWRISVDLVDNDQAYQKQEHFYSSSPKRQFAKPESFQSALLDAPIQVKGPEPSIAHMLSQPGVFYRPGQNKQAYGFYTPGVGYQYSPSEDSPAIAKIDIPKTPIFNWQNHQLYSVPDRLDIFGINKILISTHQGRQISQLKPESRCYSTSGNQYLQYLPPENDLMIGAMICEGLASPFGAGMCGACPTLFLEVFAMTPDGKLISLESREIDDDLSYREGIDFAVDPSGQGFKFYYQASIPDESQADVWDEKDVWVDKQVEMNFEWSNYLQKARSLLKN